MQPSHSTFSRAATFCEDGLVLGGDTRLASFAKGTNRLVIDPERVVGLMGAAFRYRLSDRDLSAIEKAATYWQFGDKALANLRLIFAGLPTVEAPEDVYRLKAAELLFDAGLKADDLAELLGPAQPELGKYDPDQPRVPAGSGQQSGRWTAGIWSRFSAWLDEDVPVYDTDTGDEVGTQSRARAIATNPLTILGAGAAAIAAGEVLLPAAAVAATDASVAAPAIGEVATADLPAVAPAVEEVETLTPFAQRYLSTSGGRLGGTTTRQQLYEIARDYVRSDKYERYYGDGEGSEEYIRGVGPGTKGSTYVDFTARTSNGKTVRIQTVDTLADGMTPTRSEMDAAARIRAFRPNDDLILIPKRKP